MKKPPDDNPVKPEASKPGRLAREAAALRANLLKRKNQARQRSGDQLSIGTTKPQPDR